MADDLVISVGGDISALEASLDDIPAVAQESAAKIQAAFDAIPSATDAVEAGLASLSQGLQESGAAAGEAAGHIETIPPALHDTESAASEAGDKLKEFIKTGLEIAGITVSIEALKEAMVETVAAFEQVQRAEISLTALSGSAEQARATIDQLKQLAVGEGLSFPALLTAQQRMQAFGISTNQIPALLQAAANAAAVMNKDLESAVNVLDRMAASGMASGRQLTQLGLTTHDLATAMGVADDAVQKAFKALDQSERVQVLITALEKFHGVAADLADTLTGRWQSFKTSIELATEGIGEAIATGLTGTIQTAQESVVPAVQAMAKAFTDLASVVGPPLMGVVNSLVQGFGDLATVLSAGISLSVKAITQSSDDFHISLSSLLGAVGNITPWQLMRDSVHQAIVDMNLLNASSQIASQSAADMAKKFDSVTASLTATIDKQFNLNTKIRDSQIAWSEAEQTVTDAYAKQVDAITAAQKWLDLITQMYKDGRATLGQYQEALNNLRAAQDAYNGGLSSSVLSLQQVTHEYSNLKEALAIANTNLDLVSKAYLDGKASLAQYEDAVNKLKSAQDALNGTLEKTPLQQVNDALTKLQENSDHAKAYLDAVTEAMKTNAGAAVLLAGAQKGVADAQAALTGSSQTASTTIVNGMTQISTGVSKVIEVSSNLASTAVPSFDAAASSMGVVVGQTDKIATSADAASTAMTNFVGPVQQVASAVQILNEKGSTLVSTFDAAKTTIIGAGNAFKQTAQDLLDYINAAGAATTATTNLAGAQSNLGKELDQTMAGPSEGGGTLGMRLSLQPGDQFSSPYAGIGNFVPNIGVGGVGSEYRPPETMTIDPGFNFTVNRAANNLSTAAAALTDAATAQQTAADSAYEAAKAATIGQTSLSTAADAISASVLAAADAANAAAFNTAAIGSQVMQTVTTATQTVAAATALVGATVAKVAPALGLTLGTNALLPGAPTPIVPTVSGPGGANTLVIPMPVNTGPWSPTVSGQPVTANVTVSGDMSLFAQQMFQQMMSQLQAQGIRLVRG